MRIRFSRITAVMLVFASVGLSEAQNATVTAQVQIHHLREKAKNENVVIWLKPLDGTIMPVTLEPKRYRMEQKNKRFYPHVLVIPLGSAIEFPNRDPFFHNVFSLYKGKKFDLGLYEAGSSRTVRFDQPGVSFIFCNIHPEMSAYVLAVETPYAAISDVAGRVALANVPPGRYRMEVWYERAESSVLAALSREVRVSAPLTSLGTLELSDSPLFHPEHTDKNGLPYATDHRHPY
jgi:plastocyanin